MSLANDKLNELPKSDDNRATPGGNHHSDNYSKLNQVNKDNVKRLRPAWSFSTGALNGHEGAPLASGFDDLEQGEFSTRIKAPGTREFAEIGSLAELIAAAVRNLK